MVPEQRLPRVSVSALLLLGLMALAIPASVHAQATRGSLLGTITDSSGGPTPGATVTITEQGTNIPASTVTNDSGVYNFPNIKDGIYRVEAELTGFKKVLRENVRVDVNTTVRVDFELQTGEISEVVTVTSETPALQTDRTDTGRIIEGAQIAAMPLGFGRNFQGMIATVPGASRPFKPHSEFFNSQDSLSSNVNGQSRLSNNVQVEGIDNVHRTGLLTVMVPSAEALETVSISTSNYDAEFGRAGGAVTSVTLKSGTNNFKGSGFYFGNTEATQAKNPFTDRTLPEERQKAKSAYHQGGFTFGGPIMKNRLFFFGDYIRTNDDLGRVNRFVVPTAAMRSGDFSASEHADLRSAHRRSGDRRESHAVPEQPDPGQPHQPDRAAHSREHSAAEHRRAARPGELSGHHHARAPHRRLRRQDQLSGVVEGSDLRALQLPAADGVRAFVLLRATIGGPVPGRLHRHRVRTRPTPSPATGRAPGATRS